MSRAHDRRLSRTLTRGLAVLLVLGATVPLARASAQQPLTDTSVLMRVLSVSPSTPPPTSARSPLKVTIELTNNTDQSLASVRIEGVRGNPLSDQAALEEAINHPRPPDPSLAAPIKPLKEVSTPLGPHSGATVVFETTTSTDSSAQSDPGLCICQNRIYPLIFTARSTELSGQDVTVGTTQTFVPAFGDAPSTPTQVSWLWPILERPHRLLADQTSSQPPVFLDDDLATSVSNGRLSRVLAVLSAVAGQLPITVVIDPELIDELAVMAAGNYRVGDEKKTVAGVGTDAAKQWLDQLRTALGRPNVEVSYTPFADPDIQSVVHGGLNWTQTLGPAAQQRVDAALGSPARVGNVWWPVGESLDQAALTAIVQHGASSVVLNDNVLPSTQRPEGNGLATVQTSAGPISAVVTSNAIERYVASAMSTTGLGLAALPLLVSEVAVRAIENPDVGSFVVITPPRDIDPDPATATASILGTAHQFWSTGLTVSSATTDVQPSSRGPLVPPPPSADLPSDAIRSARQLTDAVPALSSMFSEQDANRLLGSLPAGVQRAESAGWRSNRAAGAAFAARLRERIDTIGSGVRILSPTNGRYTLASNSSPLPLTVVNDLAVTVTVRVEVRTQKGLPGFTARTIDRQVIRAGSKLTLHIPTQVDRTGRFAVIAQLYTPVGEQPIGAPVALSVRSTGLGLIGVIITVAAGAILLLALVIRVFRRWRGRGRETPPPGPAEQISPASVPV